MPRQRKREKSVSTIQEVTLSKYVDAHERYRNRLMREKDYYKIRNQLPNMSADELLSYEAGWIWFSYAFKPYNTKFILSEDRPCPLTMQIDMFQRYYGEILSIVSEMLPVMHFVDTGRNLHFIYDMSTQPLSFFIEACGGNVNEFRQRYEECGYHLYGAAEYLHQLSRIWCECQSEYRHGSATRFIPAWCPTEEEKFKRFKNKLPSKNIPVIGMACTPTQLIRFILARRVTRKGTIRMMRQYMHELELDMYFDAVMDGVPIEDLLA